MSENSNLIITAVVSMSVFGGLLGFVLSAAQKKLFVKKNHRVDNIIAQLPGANCGACGKAGCSSYAVLHLLGVNIIKELYLYDK